ncbi:DUF1472 domain-containing protein [Salmonella enterica]|uniref:DUF1472 domain-containing protein n=2 Tax=Enterobacteriaceae TaxID=543 RepID=A0A8S7S6Z4_ECOLX|nr:DUF1472 domain-containing protein [Salmonella enterica]EBV0871103.1 DUF1472 domain-containing protein [Salmonella enterica subsp. enterica serovar Braenderup]EBX6086473.1 DUF1472 domain-containing protein [Salmonella enterica subsp. enterica serovar Weltevreden]EBX6573264.1 DUF1472 domain-containing protein [Salmonella enterica subsp. enterica serovar Typhimurium]EBZ3517738.1 DUF1472 domain-containing protein [Salmonella enterica subsp. enterica serovar Montevideo]ECA8287678.1 DUF1472 domai
MRRVLCTRRNKEVAGGSAFTRPCGAWPCGFSALWPQRRVRAVPCLHLSRAGRDARVRFAAAVTRSLLPVCRDFPVVHPLRFRGLTLQLPPAVCVRLRLPLRPMHPRLIARLLWRHGTARCRRTCDYGGFGNVCCCTCCIRWNLAQIQLWKHRRTLV